MTAANLKSDVKTARTAIPAPVGADIAGRGVGESLSREAPARAKIVCREIREDDLDPIAVLLTDGFATHDLLHWRKVCQRLTARDWPDKYPRFGWLLEADGKIVGSIFTIYTVTAIQGAVDARCSTSSWYVAPEFRGHGMRLARRAIMHSDVTYFNPTPGDGTARILDHLGYEIYCRGHFFALAALNLSFERAKVHDWRAFRGRSGVTADDAALLDAHHGYGCVSLVCETSEGAVPFVFLKRVSPKRVPYAQLLYCRRASDIIRFAGPIGRRLALKGMPFIAIDSNGPIRGLKGWFMDDRPIYYKGPEKPRIGDLAHTELAFFGK